MWMLHTNNLTVPLWTTLNDIFCLMSHWQIIIFRFFSVKTKLTNYSNLWTIRWTSILTASTLPVFSHSTIRSQSIEMCNGYVNSCKVYMLNRTMCIANVSKSTGPSSDLFKFYSVTFSIHSHPVRWRTSKTDYIRHTLYITTTMSFICKQRTELLANWLLYQHTSLPYKMSAPYSWNLLLRVSQSMGHDKFMKPKKLQITVEEQKDEPNLIFQKLFTQNLWFNSLEFVPELNQSIN